MGESELAEGLMMKGWNSGRPCDSCGRAPASVFCRAHTAFLCLDCDASIHPDLNPQRVGATRHGRVMVCEVCEQAPAAFACKADAALLCLACDTDIHSANPLARRHERTAVEPFYDSAAEAIARSAPATSFKLPGLEDLGIDINPTSTIPPLPLLGAHDSTKSINLGSSQFDGVKSEDQLLFFPEILEPVSLLDFEFHNLGPQVGTTDSLVPVQMEVAAGCGDGSIIDFSRANLSPPFDYVQSQSINHSLSSSSVDVGVVPDGSSMSDISFPYIHHMTPSGADVVSNCLTLSSGTNSASSQSGGSNPCGVDREARVLRYREKRKNRKFEKTIRYASRKAYAESRPRIKGRFAKRTEPDRDHGPGLGRLFTGSRSSVPFVGADVQYGVVPTF